jgi:hypothetical protein
MMEMSELCSDELSEKGLAFVRAIEAVCKSHGIQLSVSDYDAFQLWPLQEGDSCLYAPTIEDITVTND